MRRGSDDLTSNLLISYGNMKITSRNSGNSRKIREEKGVFLRKVTEGVVREILVAPSFLCYKKYKYPAG
jgi:hypothetical protein